ncbi:MAG: hypothetical protein AAF447_08100 [Myxococcota bacterium]
MGCLIALTLNGCAVETLEAPEGATVEGELVASLRTDEGLQMWFYDLFEDDGLAVVYEAPSEELLPYTLAPAVADMSIPDMYEALAAEDAPAALRAAYADYMEAWVAERAAEPEAPREADGPEPSAVPNAPDLSPLQLGWSNQRWQADVCNDGNERCGGDLLENTCVTNFSAPNGNNRVIEQGRSERHEIWSVPLGGANHQIWIQRQQVFWSNVAGLQQIAGVLRGFFVQYPGSRTLRSRVTQLSRGERYHANAKTFDDCEPD